MVRWSENLREYNHIATLGPDIVMLPALVEVQLHDGRVFRGRKDNMPMWNNAAEIYPPTQAAGVLVLTQIDGSAIEIDLLDIRWARSCWDRFKDDFLRAGLIEVAELPN
jgi:hypothetical protein